MTAPLLAGAWAVLVLGGAHRIRSRGPLRRPPPAATPASVGSRRELLAALGDRVLRLAGRAPQGEAGGRMGRALLVATGAAVVSPLIAVPAGAMTWAAPAISARRSARRHADELRRTLPEVIDLLAVAAGAGLNVAHAVDAAARRAPGPLAVELGRALSEVAGGHRLADALEGAADRAGEPARPVVAALVASERYGAPLAAALERLAADARADRRRHGEAAARRVPVTLLFPLVCCILPAFALLTVAPLIAGALGSLAL